MRGLCGAAAGNAGGGVRRSFAGEMRNHDSGLGFGSSLVQEIARMTGNPIGGLRRGIGERRRRLAASGGERFVLTEKWGEGV
jgi:hypothetical protein